MSLTWVCYRMVLHTSLCYPVFALQNAGKSSLISAMKRVGGTAGQRDPTVAPLPGTTLGLINVPGECQKAAGQELCRANLCLWCLYRWAPQRQERCYLGTGMMAYIICFSGGARPEARVACLQLLSHFSSYKRAT
jgi:hypothetical protein